MRLRWLSAFLAAVVAAGCSGSDVGPSSTTEGSVPVSTSEVFEPKPPSAVSTTTSTGVDTSSGGDLLSDPEFVAWATEIGFLTEDGYFGPVDEDGSPLRLPPITGYADFSDFSPQQVFDLDGAMVDSLLAECVGDQDPRFADGIGPDGRFFWGQLPEGLDQSGFATYVACMEGLNKPDPVPRTEEQWAESYAYTMALFDCEEGFGAVWPNRPSLDEWIAADGSWEFEFDPYEDLEIGLDELHRMCPSSPVGGFGAWDSGDPVALP